MPHHEPRWLGDWLACMADATVESAELLNAFNQQQRDHFLVCALKAGLSAMPELFTQLAPTSIQFRRHRFEVQMHLTIRHERRMEVGVYLFGRPVTQLFHARFGSKHTTYDRLTADIEAVSVNSSSS